MSDDRARRVASEHWPALLAEVEALLGEYEAEGWETLLVRPGDVTPVAEGERCGFDLLVSGDDYEALAELIEERGIDFPGSEVYSREESGIVLLVVLMLDPRTEAAVAFPAYYDREEARPTFDRASDEGELAAYLRRLNDDTIVFSYDDPFVFRPAGSERDGGDEHA